MVASMAKETVGNFRRQNRHHNPTAEDSTAGSERVKGLTLGELKSHLWNCAEILRGSAVDRTDWKAYILPLLFFKRICDVWDEETEGATKLYGDVDPVDFPKIHRFNVPHGCQWRDVREAPANVGASLAHAMREIERANPESLYRVFGALGLGKPGDAHGRDPEGPY